MFETAVLSSGPQTKRVWSTMLGIGGQAVLLGCLVLAPMIWPQALPRVAWAISLAPPSPPPAPPAPLNPQVIPVTHVVATRQLSTILTAPSAIPNRVPVIIDTEVPVTGPYIVGAVPGSGPGVPGGGLASDVIGSVGRATPRPPDPPPPPAPAVTTAPAPKAAPRITQLQMAEPIQRITPVYPPIARTTRIQGKVELMGVLGTDGRIHEVKVLSGHPFLVRAAVDAVMQWVYRPTILNGQAVEVQAPITVTFILN